MRLHRLRHVLIAPRRAPLRLTRRLRSLAALLRRHRRPLFRCGLAIAAAGLLLFIIALCWPMQVDRYLSTSPSPELLDRAGRPLFAYLNPAEQWCFPQPLDSISPLLARATLAAEDRRFERHHGVDPLAIVRASWQLLRHGRVRSGASTLTMQVVKLAGHPSHSLPGKLRQTLDALRLERRVGKDQILAAYLNRAPYGMNLVGCEAAARRYYGKPSRELSLSEAALLAALPKSPTRLMPLGNNHARLQARRNWVLGRMREEGFITEAERARAAAAPLEAEWHGFPRLAPHLATRLEPRARAATRLATTLDRDAQASAERLLREHLKTFGGKIRNGALIVAEPRSGAVLAWVGSANFWSWENGCQVDAARARRSPGSTLKPFIYAQALERNALYPSETLLDGSFDLGTYNPKNFDKRYHGLITADAALRRSLNVPAIMTLERVGQPIVYDFLRRAGLDTLNRPAWSYGLGLAVGACEARLDQLCAAYAMLANGGLHQPLKITLDQPDDQSAIRNPQSAISDSAIRNPQSAIARPLLARGTALALFQMMEQPLPDELDAAALGTAAIAPRVCWKTGTSTGNHDAWAFVFNAQYVVGVWMGNPDGRSSSRLVGAEAALPLAGRIFRRLPPSAAPAWPDPGDDLAHVEVCAVSGLPRSGWCERTRTVLIPRRQFLGRICDIHWPDPDALPGSERPGVIERWPASARDWDLARIGAPPAERRLAGARAASVRALQILNPPRGARFILTGEAQGDRIPLRSSNDAAGPVHWYLNGKFLATAEPNRPVMLALTPGSHKLVCMTPRGATAQARFIVANPVSANPEMADAP